MLANPNYAVEVDLQPYHEFATEMDECQWQDFMSGDWAWNQVVSLFLSMFASLKFTHRIKLLRIQTLMA